MRENLYNDDGRQYLQLMQDNITRMAGNSANCKTWLVTLTTGLLAIGASIESLNGWLFLTILPIFVFWSLDTYYLKLERGLRNRERLFINIVNSNDYNDDDYIKALFSFKPFFINGDDDEVGLVSTERLEWSDSICPFYVLALFVSTVVSVVVLLTH